MEFKFTYRKKHAIHFEDESIDSFKPFIVVANGFDGKNMKTPYLAEHDNAYFFQVDYNDKSQMEETFDAITEIAYTYKFNHDYIFELNM